MKMSDAELEMVKKKLPPMLLEMPDGMKQLRNFIAVFQKTEQQRRDFVAEIAENMRRHIISELGT